MLPRKMMFKIAFNKHIKGLRHLTSYAPFYLSSKSSGVIIFSKNITSRGYLSIRSSKGAIIEIGQNCFFNYNVSITALSGVKIGHNCKFGNNVVIVDQNHIVPKENDPMQKDDFSSEKIVIGNNVWIGANCVILKGTTIGDNSIVAAGSVLKGKFGSNTLIHNGCLIKGE